MMMRLPTTALARATPSVSHGPSRGSLCGRLCQACTLVALFTAPSVVHAKTVVLTAESCDRMAAISEAAPRQSWAMNERVSGEFDTSRVQLAEGHSFLVRFSLAAIPPGQRIAHGELTLPVADFAGNEPRFYVWRLLAAWDAGVCHQYRSARPKLLAWTKPGARGLSSDRATRPTDIVRVAKSPVTVNVTEDVLLWYTGGAQNNGWMLTVEDPALAVYLTSPVASMDGRRAWKLRITYEPR